MTPIATVGVPHWGSTRTPVLAIDGDRWTVLGPTTKMCPDGRRVLEARCLNLLALCPARVGLVVEHEGERKQLRPIGTEVVGGDWYAARQKRRGQLLWLSRNGWSVRVSG